MFHLQTPGDFLKKITLHIRKIHILQGPPLPLTMEVGKWSHNFNVSF